MPVEIGSGLGRKRSWSLGASTHPRSHHQDQSSCRHHQGGDSFEPIYSGVHVEIGGGGGEECLARVGLGRQRSRSAGELMRLRHGNPGGSEGVVGGRELCGYHQEQHEERSTDTVTGRQQSRGVGEKIRPHMHPHVHPPQLAVPETRPLALGDKYVDGRGSPSCSRMRFLVQAPLRCHCLPLLIYNIVLYLNIKPTPTIFNLNLNTRHPHKHNINQCPVLSSVCVRILRPTIARSCHPALDLDLPFNPRNIVHPPPHLPPTSPLLQQQASQNQELLTRRFMSRNLNVEDT